MRFQRPTLPLERTPDGAAQRPKGWPKKGGDMSAEQVAEIAPGIRESLAGGDSACATFAIAGDESRGLCAAFSAKETA